MMGIPKPNFWIFIQLKEFQKIVQLYIAQAVFATVSHSHHGPYEVLGVYFAGW